MNKFFLKLITIIKTHYLFLLLLLLSISFLIIQGGVWSYLDNRWMLFYKYFQTDIFQEIFYAWNTSTFFGYDKAATLGPRILNTFITVVLDQKLVFALFFLGSYFFAYKIFLQKFNRTASIFGALLFSFNPVSIHFLNYASYFFAYFSFPILLYSSILFVKTGRYWHLLFLYIGGIFLFSYTRIIGLYGLLMLGLFLFFIKDIFILIRQKFKRVLIASMVFIMSGAMVIFSYLAPIFTQDSKYFVGISNYAQTTSAHAKTLYQRELSDPFFLGFMPKDIIKNFSGAFQSTDIFIYGSLLMISALLLSYAFIFKEQRIKDRIGLYIFAFILFLFGIRQLAFFVDLEIFKKIVYNYFPVLSGELKWMFLAIIPLLSYILAFEIHSLSKKKIRYGVMLLSIVYMLFSIYPLVNFWKNEKQLTISKGEIPQNYLDTFSYREDFRESALFIPYFSRYTNEPFLLSWSKYPIMMNYNANYNVPLSLDHRFTAAKQIELYKHILQNNYGIIHSFLNVKNIFLMNEVQSMEVGQFDWHHDKKVETELERNSKILRESSDLTMYEDKGNFTHFRSRLADKFEFFLYAPANIEKKEIKQLSAFNNKKEEWLWTKPINIDKKSFLLPEKMKNFAIADENKNIHVTYKQSKRDSTKIFAKISNVDSSKPFLLQLNQTFGMTWRVKWIKKSDFDAIKCTSEYVTFDITQNSRCFYEGKILDFSPLLFLNNPQVPDKKHFEGNFVGNTWLIEEEDIPDYIDNNELYALIIYEKQLWYIGVIVMMCGIFIMLFLLTIFQFLNSYKYKNYE